MSYPFNTQFGTSDFMDESQQQLSPVTGYPQWETIERGEQQQHQIESPLDTNMDSTTPTGPTPIAFRSINIEMDEMSRNIMPSAAAQIDNTPITLHHPHVLHQQLHLQQQQQQHHQQQFLQRQYHQQHQQSRHPSVEPFSTHSSRPGSSQLHIVTSPTDTFRPQSTTPLTPNPTTESGPSTSNTAGGRGTSRKTSGAIRSSGRVTRSQQHAPYYRPSPASTTASYLGLDVPHAGSGSSTSSTPRIPQQAEPTPRKQTVRFTAVTTPAPIQTRAASRAAASSMMPSPVVQLGSPTSQSPEFSGSAATLRQTEVRFSPMTRRPSRPQSTDQTRAPPQQRTSAHSQSPPHAPQTQPQPQVQIQPPQTSSAAIRSYVHTRRPLNITSDMHYSNSSNILHAFLELPGVKKRDVQIKLATCYFNHVKFVSVHAESVPVFDLPGAVESGTGAGGGDQTQTQTQDTSSGAKPTQTSSSINPDLRERRFGMLRRVIQVPSTTKPEDIDASMEDGVLSLKIYCGKPYELDDEQTIVIH